MPAYCTGMSQPPKGTIFAPALTWTSWSGVRLSGPDSWAVIGSRRHLNRRARSHAIAASLEELDPPGRVHVDQGATSATRSCWPPGGRPEEVARLHRPPADTRAAAQHIYFLSARMIVPGHRAPGRCAPGRSRRRRLRDPQAAVLHAAVAVAFQRCPSAVRCTTSSIAMDESRRHRYSTMPHQRTSNSIRPSMAHDIGQGHELGRGGGPVDAPRPECRRRHATWFTRWRISQQKGPPLGSAAIRGAEGDGHLGGEGQRGGLSPPSS